MTQRRALVVGTQFAGLATALRLRQSGWDVILSEENAAVAERAGDTQPLLAAGRRAVERLGVLGELKLHSPPRIPVRTIDRVGNRFGGPGHLQQRHESMRVAATDLTGALRRALGKVDVRGGRIVSFHDHADEVEVAFTGSDRGDVRETVQLVVGADGAHSAVREHLVGRTDGLRAVSSLMTCAVELREPVPGFGREESLTLSEPGRSLWILPGVHHPVALFSYYQRHPTFELSGGAVAAVRAAFGTEFLGPVLEHVLGELEEADNYVFGPASQVVLDSWRRGRMILLGDAAWHMTLYSPSGPSAALSGAVLLGDLLDRHPESVDAALEDWEHRARPLIVAQQREARAVARFLAPQSRLALVRRNVSLRRCPRVAPAQHNGGPPCARLGVGAGAV